MVTIRYNTMANNLGPATVQLARTSDVQIDGNIMSRPQPGREAVATFQLSGSGDVVRDNAYWRAARTSPGDPRRHRHRESATGPGIHGIGMEEMRAGDPRVAASYGTTAQGDISQDPSPTS